MGNHEEDPNEQALREAASHSPTPTPEFTDSEDEGDDESYQSSNTMSVNKPSYREGQEEQKKLPFLSRINPFRTKLVNPNEVKGQKTDKCGFIKVSDCDCDCV